MKLHLRDVEVDGTRVDVSVQDGLVVAVRAGLDVAADAEVMDGHGGALLPGLWDHHIHLTALAALRRSVVVGPPEVSGPDDLAAALAAARPTDPRRWVRAVGYHESVAGPLERDRLDQLLPDVPVRVQHRSGALWVLSGTAIDRLGLEHHEHDGLERDASGRLTGRLYGSDRWLRDQLAGVEPAAPPDLAPVGRELASYGVVGLSDATPFEDVEDLELLAGAAARGDLPQRIVAMGGPPLTTAAFPAPLGRGPVKLLLADHALPSLERLAGWISDAHTAGRPIAAHCVTRASLVLALAALDTAGVAPGDRIEHGAVVPPELRSSLVAHGATVVTQPNFVAERGDQYLADVEADDQPHLYPCRSLLDAGIPVAGSTDAPFGHPDPWRAIVAATERRAPSGRRVAGDEAVTPAAALGLFLGPPGRPGSGPRRVVAGAPADLCLLRAPLSDVLGEPSVAAVGMTLIGGEVVHGS